MFVQTSTHEGFALPPLESMATGGAVVCTDAHGNRDFCVDGENCLMPEPDVGSVSAALRAAARRPRAARAPGRGGRRDGPGLRLGAADRRARGVPGGRRAGRGRCDLDGHGAVPEAAARRRAEVRRAVRRVTVKAEFVAALRCPACRREHSLALCVEAQRRARGARGPAALPACARASSRVHRGVPELLYDAAAAHPRRGRRARALRRADARPRAGTARPCSRLPDVEHGYWYVQARSMHQLLTTVPFQRRREHPRRRLEHLLGGQPLRRARPARDRAGHRDGRAAGPVHGRLVHRARARLLRAGARLDGRDPAGLEQRRLRVLLRGPAPQRRRRPAPDVRRDLPRAAARRAAADGQRDAQDGA